MLQKYWVVSRRGRGIDADRAVGLGDLGELVGNHILLGVFDRCVKGRLQFFQLGLVAPDALAVFEIVGGVGLFDFFECDFFGWIVGSADVFGALEGEVLEHVREARLAAGIVGVARIDAGIEGEDGSLGAFADDQREAVGQHLDGDSFFKTCQVLGVGDRRGKEQQREEPC